MNKDYISKVLKAYRKKNNFKVSDVAIILSNNGKPVAEKTVYGWESGQALPDADCLIKLCVLYNITDVPWAFGFTKNTDVIIPTKHESEVIRKYRSETDMQQAVDKLLGVNQNYSKNILTS